MSNDTPASGKSEFMRGHPHIRSEGADVTRPSDEELQKEIYSILQKSWSNAGASRMIVAYIHPFLKSR